MIILRDKY